MRPQADKQTSKESTDAGYDALLFRIWDPNLLTGNDLYAPHWTHYCSDWYLQVCVTFPTMKEVLTYSIRGITTYTS